MSKLFKAHGKIVKKLSLNGILDLPKVVHSKNPLLVYLHGLGCMGHSIANSVPEKYGFIHLAPVCWDDQAWNPDEIIVLIDQICKNYPVDKCRIYMTGFSMGARGVWDTACMHPNKFAGLLPISGYTSYINAPKIRQIPVWAFHGSRDYVVPCEESVKMINAMKRAGAKDARLHIFKGGGHDPAEFVYGADVVMDWLTGFSKF